VRAPADQLDRSLSPDTEPGRLWFTSWMGLTKSVRLRDGIRAELEHARATFHALVQSAGEEELGQQSNGTRWTNRQLLFHMMFGYMLVRSLLALVKCFSRLPLSSSRVFARFLDALAGPFHLVNYSCAGSRFYRDKRMEPKFYAVVASLQRRLDAESEGDMQRAMAYPVRWDPFFKPSMTLADVYHYPTQHFEFHRRQLTLDPLPQDDGQGLRGIGAGRVQGADARPRSS
jgi:hypothetical protein